MIDAVVKLVWNYTIFCALFEKNDICREAREMHAAFFITMHDSLLCSFCVTTDLLFHEDTNGKATSLCNLIRDIEVSKPDLAKTLNEKIHANKVLLNKIGILRNQVCAHRWESKTPEGVFSEAGVKLNMMTTIVDLAKCTICQLAEDAGGNRKENLEKQQLSKDTLESVANDAGQIMRTFVANLKNI